MSLLAATNYTKWKKRKMVLIIVPDSVLICGEMPNEVRNYLSPSVWQEILNSISVSFLNDFESMFKIFDLDG